jgi:hypothetical protein
MYIVEDGFKRHNSKPQYPITNQCSNWKILECELHVVIGNEINNIVFTYRPHSIKYI